MISRPAGPARGVSAIRVPPERERPVTATAEHPPERPRRRVFPPLVTRSGAEVTHRSHPVRRGLRGPEAKTPVRRSRRSTSLRPRGPLPRTPACPGHGRPVTRERWTPTTGRGSPRPQPEAERTFPTARHSHRGPEAKASAHRSRTSRRSACRSPLGPAPKTPAHSHRPSPRASPRTWRTAGTHPSHPVGRDRPEKARPPHPGQAHPDRRTPPPIMVVPPVLPASATTAEPAGHPAPWTPAPTEAPRARPTAPTTPCPPGGTMAPDIPTPRADPTKP